MIQSNLLYTVTIKVCNTLLIYKKYKKKIKIAKVQRIKNK